MVYNRKLVNGKFECSSALDMNLEILTKIIIYNQCNKLENLKTYTLALLSTLFR